MSFSSAEISFLSVHLADIADWASSRSWTSRATIANQQAARSEFGDYGRAVVELITAQRTADHKFRGGAFRRYLMDNESAQQATPWQVAAHRAAEIARRWGSGVVVYDATCSIGTEGLELAPPAEPEGRTAPTTSTAPGAAENMLGGYVGADLDGARLLMARHNLRTSGRRAWLVRADATMPIAQKADVVIADPARRAGGRRLSRVEDLHPPLPALLEAHRHGPLAVKCAPGIDYSEWNGTVAVFSVGGAVKETCLYTPEWYRQEGGWRREAIVLDKDGRATRYTDATPDTEDLCGPPGRFIIDPDGAIVRAGVVQDFARRHGLWMLDPRIAYVTGDAIPPGCSGMEIIEQVPLKRLREAMTRHDAGSAEIMARGVQIDPDQLRKKLKLRGSQPRAVVITRLGRSAVAFVCHARTHYDEDVLN